MNESIILKSILPMTYLILSIFPFPFVSSSSSYVMISYADHYMTWMDFVTVVVVVS